MKIKLTPNFKKRERDLINCLLVEIDFGATILVGSGCVMKFLTKLAYHESMLGPKIEILDQYTSEEKVDISIKLVELIFTKDEWIIKIFMKDSPTVMQLLSLRTLKKIMITVIEKITNLLESNEEARHQIVQSVIDIHILSQNGTTFGKKVLNILYEKKDLFRLIHNQQEFMESAQRYPQLFRFLILSLANDFELMQKLLLSHDLYFDMIGFAKSKTRDGKLPSDIEKSFNVIHNFINFMNK